MELLHHLEVPGSYCIVERKIDEVRRMFGNAAETRDEGAGTWFTFASIRHLQIT